MAVIALKTAAYNNKIEPEVKIEYLSIMYFYVKRMYNYYTQDELRNAVIYSVNAMQNRSKESFYLYIENNPTLKTIYSIVKMPYYTDKQRRTRYKDYLSKGLVKGSYNDALTAFIYYIACGIETKRTYVDKHSLVKELLNSDTTSMIRMVRPNTLGEVKLRALSLFIRRFIHELTDFKWNNIHNEWDKNGLIQLFEDLAGHDSDLKNIYEIYGTNPAELKDVINTTADLYRKELEK